MNARDRAAIEARHWPCSTNHTTLEEFTADVHCAGDGDDWPCDAVRLLAALREAESRIVALRDTADRATFRADTAEARLRELRRGPPDDRA